MAQAAATPAPESAVRVMIVDDSVVVRGLVARWVESIPGFVVAARAPDGRSALAGLDAARPDIILLDVDMPGLDGVALLPMLLARRPDVAIVMVSTLTQRNAEISLRCLSLGAVDYLPKPASQRELTLSLSFRDELAHKLQGLATRHSRGVPHPAHEPPRVAPAPAALPPTSFAAARRRAPHLRCLVLGASTGGPRALTDLIKRLGPVSERVPILVVQHMPPIFTAVFAEHLRHETGLAVREGQEGEALAPGRIYIAPGGRHMGLHRSARLPLIRLDDGPAIGHCRPALDLLLHDAVGQFGAGLVVAVLTGMGHDGTAGAREAAAAGATILVQDEPSSVVWGMPGSIARAGLAHEILPVPAMARTIAGLAGVALP
ncbi:MAG: chemotaxis-specific protein-glutamate methyltransferase CheB [Methylobacteriaceae bacterium]|nr:chemotaxis-specific protein-glutamate methyltransferase CheB [Methylobacteriaceae bacterium]